MSPWAVERAHLRAAGAAGGRDLAGEDLDARDGLEALREDGRPVVGERVLVHDPAASRIVLEVVGVVALGLLAGRRLLARLRDAAAHTSEQVSDVAPEEQREQQDEDAAETAADGETRAASTAAAAAAPPAVADARLIQRYVLAKLHAAPLPSRDPDRGRCA